MLNTTDETTLRSDFVTAMRNVANSVTIVATDGPAGRYGATVSSFCSVSADPPTVLVCLNIEAKTAHAVRSNGNFCVNVLPAGEVDAAKRFAGLTSIEEDNRFEDGNWSIQNGDAPSLHGTTAFRCTVEEIIEATSHLIFTGRVQTVQHGTANPLIYLDGEFCKTIPSENA